ncbi:energy transducer TonB [Synoicihabitans lomoniglobus]|uniref:TonB family protein n=1 Tax=Synoicihabitans lomoniglobus TaxID=2909285 RepID=A0AAF0CS92_9BACT|nr:TonB family protein [Opitutaceae bacterium LMO-M01]WED67087.1 TonB family protein [Opitutaceae bacterium LMO-M01]
MKSSFTLPVIIAASSHALFLFGFNSRKVASSMPLPLEPVERITVYPIEFIEPDEPENVFDAAEAPAASDRTSHAGEFAPDPTNSPDLPPPALPERIPTVIPTFGQKLQPPRPGNGGSWLERGVEAGVFHASGLDREPRATFRMSPRYPDTMRRAGIEESVVVEFIVGLDGRVIEAKAATNARREFAAAAERAVQRWRFEPGKRHGKVVSFRMSVPIVFSLGE